MEDEFGVAEAVQEARVDNVHDVGKIHGALGALGPTAVCAKEFFSASISQQSFRRLVEIHMPKLRHP
jgi:hypothetical protein